jgi:acetolactate synthase-1/2/3 large subunit
MAKVCDYICEFLIKNNIDTIFTLSGGFIGPILNSISKYNIKYYCLCHEQSCAMAADSYYRIARKPCCLLITNGPGSSNTLTGVIGAFQDSIPIFILSGNVPTNQSLDSQELPLRQLGVQELNIIPIVQTFTKYAKNIKCKYDIIKSLEIAYEICISGRMGPVWLDIPLDIQNQTLDNIQNEQLIDKQIVTTKSNKSTNYNFIVNKINSSKRPLFIIGNGIWLSKTENLFKEILEITQIPVVSSWLAKDVIINNHHLYFGNIGILGERFANFAIQKCDLLICLGCRLTITQIGYDTEGFSRESYKIMVDVDKSELDKKIINIDMKINEDLFIFLNNFKSYLSNNKLEHSLFDRWMNNLNYWKKKFPSYDSDINFNANIMRNKTRRTKSIID